MYNSDNDKAALGPYPMGPYQKNAVARSLKEQTEVLQIKFLPIHPL